MSLISYAFSANYKRFLKNLKEISKRENKSYIGLIFDTVYCVLRYGLALTDYLNYKVYSRTRKERKEIVGYRMADKFYQKVSPSEYKDTYTIKPMFLEKFKEYTKRDYVVPAENNYEQFLEFIKKHPTFMIKPLNGLGGKGVSKENANEIDDKKAYFDNALKQGMYFESLVIQHPDMNVLCAKSVNTMRVMTFNDHGKPRILWMCLRVGNGINSIDNFHAQGMAVNIDMETGKLVGNAIDKDLNEFVEHPTTHVKFDGFQIPCFKEAKELALKACTKNDKILVVGWDVAISEDGPVMIEGNRRPGFDLPQVLSDRGRMDIIRDVLKDLDK